MDNKRRARLDFLIDFGYFSAIAVIIIFSLRYLFSLFLPFLIAFSISAALLPLTKKLLSLRISSTFVSILLTVFVYFVIVSAIFGIVRGIMSELADFANRILDDPSGFLSPLRAFIDNLSQKLKFLPSRDIKPFADDFIYSKLSSLGEYLLGILTSFAFSIPDYIFFVFTLVSSTYYLLKFSGSFSSFFKRFLPRGFYDKLVYSKNHFYLYAKSYLFLTLFILCLTFIELFIGFSFLGTKYALLLSFVVAIVDMLPVFGVGTVLIPWIIFEFIKGDIKSAIILLILYIIATATRSFVEHKMLSRSFDMPPLVTLTALFVGYKLFGVLGLLITPFLSSLLFALIKQRIDKHKENG